MDKMWDILASLYWGLLFVTQQHFPQMSSQSTWQNMFVQIMYRQINIGEKLGQRMNSNNQNDKYYDRQRNRKNNW